MSVYVLFCFCFFSFWCLCCLRGAVANGCGCSVSFILTGLLVWRDDRANKVGGGASYA